MLLGVVGDTHNHVPNIEKIIDIFNLNNVDAVIHTGDITQAKTLSRFSRLNCPLSGVYGNNDLEEEGLEETAKKNGFDFKLPPLLLELKGRTIAVFHEPQSIDSFLKKNPSIDLIIHGHTHNYRNEKLGNVTVINPGECAGMIKGSNSVGILKLADLTFERIFF